MPNFKTKRFEWDSNDNLTYVGLHEIKDAPEGADGYWIKRLEWDSNDNLVNISKDKGKWSERYKIL